MRRIFWMTGGLVLAALAAIQCGYPSFDFTPISSTGGGGGMAGSGGMGDVTSTSSGTTTQPPCSLTMQDCGAGMRCTIRSVSTGTTKCVAVDASARQTWDACLDDNVCPAGTWCDGRTKVCAPFCETSKTCGKGSCVSATNPLDGKGVPEARVCTAFCDPVSAVPCGTGATCAQDTSVLQFDCFSSGGHPVGGMCMMDQDCDKGGVCSGSGKCLQWCTPIGGSPPECAIICSQFADGPVVYDGKSYGYCQ